MTHDELIQRAMRWLVGTGKCWIAASEVIAGREVVDAIGWNMSESIQIECKTSKADFRRDLKKDTRRPSKYNKRDYGVGNTRYYMAPPGVIPKTELPEGWGLLEVYPGIVRKVVGGWPCFRDDGIDGREKWMLIRIITRKFGFRAKICPGE